MRAASFYMAGRLYGFEFKKLAAGTVPVFEANVVAYEVHDKVTGRLLGLYYTDDYARPGKRSGAWMTTYRAFSQLDGSKVILASNNNNFNKPEPGEPVLLSLDDAETMFHEFGHTLHYFSSVVTYPTFGETPRDFVEYPSQVHEHWVLTRPILDGFMKHYQTGAAMPQALVDKALAASTFNQGYATVSYLSSAIVDMDLHTQPRRRPTSTPLKGLAGADRDAQGDRDAAPPAAVQSPVHVRRLFGRVLQLPVVRDDGRRHLGLFRGVGRRVQRRHRGPLQVDHAGPPATPRIAAKPIASSAAATRTWRRCSRCAASPSPDRSD